MEETKYIIFIFCILLMWEQIETQVIKINLKIEERTMVHQLPNIMLTVVKSKRSKITTLIHKKVGRK